MSLSTKLQTGFLAALSALMIPFLLLNIFGSIISGIWLAILGEWNEIFRGVIFMIISSFAIAIALMPSMLFAIPGVWAMEKGKKLLSIFFTILSVLYTYALIIIWCTWIMWLFVSSATESTLIPLLIWSYGVALAPWMFLNQKDQQGGGNEFSALTTSFTQIAYVLGMIFFFLGANMGSVFLIFVLVMLISAVIQIYIVAKVEFKKAIAKKEVKIALDILSEIGQKFDNDAFEQIKEYIEDQLTSDTREFIETTKKTSVQQWVYSAVANLAGNLVESGHYHIYRGVLNPMGPGEDFLKIFDWSIDKLGEIKAIDKDMVKKEKEAIRKNIKDVG